MEKALQTAIANLIATYQAELEIGLWLGDASGTIYDFQGEKFFSAASMIKLPIYLRYLEAFRDGELGPEKEILVEAEKIVGGAGYLQLLPTKKHWQLQELMTAMIAVSDNTATNLLLEIAGIESMQTWLQAFSGIQLQRFLMRPLPGKENRMTATAAGQMLRRIYQFSDNQAQQASDLQPFLKQQFREGLPGLLDEQEIVGLDIYNKTGRLDRIEHDAACFDYQGQPVFISAFTRDLTGRGQGIMFLRQLGELVFKNYFADQSE